MVNFFDWLHFRSLPLVWLRLPLLLATFGLSGVCIAVAVQAIHGYVTTKALLSII